MDKEVSIETRTCDEWEEMLALAQFDGLSKEQQMELSAHVFSCVSCSESLTHYLQIKKYIHAIAQVPADSRALPRPNYTRRGLPDRLLHPPTWLRRLLHLLMHHVRTFWYLWLAPFPAIISLLFGSYFLRQTSRPLWMIWSITYLPGLLSVLGITAYLLWQHRKRREQRTYRTPSFYGDARRTSSHSVPRDRYLLMSSCLCLSLILIIGTFLVWPLAFPLRFQSIPAPNACPVITHELLGVSGGEITFDRNRLDGSLKCQAAQQWQKKSYATASTLWDRAIQKDSSDAEALIYREDARVLSTHKAYETFVVTVAMVPDYSGNARNILQGAYLAQKENNQNAHNVPVRLLIASIGTDPSTAIPVARQVVQMKQHDPSIMGILGWPDSQATLDVINALPHTQIPIVSATNSSNILSARSPFFFRVAPTDREQGAVGATYAKENLKTHKVVLFVDDQDAYSSSLASSFQQMYEDNSHQVILEHYTRKNSESIASRMSDALAQHPDLIYFSGYTSDLTPLLSALPDCTQKSCLKIMGGDALAVVGDYTPNELDSYGRFLFTAFADAEEWQGRFISPSFFNVFGNTFDPQHNHPLETRGYNLPDADTILAYDALQALIKGCQLVGGHCSSPALRDALTKLSWQGVSGPISFDSQGNAHSKPVLILQGGAGGVTSLIAIQGGPLQK